jgi:hypothetical protein
MLAKITAMLVAASAAGGVYVSPTPSRGGELVSCPSLVGLQGFSNTAVITARADVMRYGRVSLADDLAASDLSWQPSVRITWRTATHKVKGKRVGEVVLGPTHASRNPYSVIVRRSCGQKVVARSITFTTVPGSKSHPMNCEACRGTIFLIDRRGYPLIYFAY